MAQGIKRLGISVAVLIAVAVTGAFALSLTIDRGALRQAVEMQLRAATGLQLAVDGAIDVTIFPRSTVVFSDVRLKSDGDGNGDAALSVKTLTANLRLLPLLLRRFEIADVELGRPSIHVVRDTDGRSNWTPFIDSLTRTMKPGLDDQVSFSEIRLQDGELSYRDQANGLHEHISDIDLSLAWPSISRTFAATGQFDWRGERIDGSITVADFIAALSGERSGLKLRVAGAPMKIAFDGTIANKASLVLTGTVSADSVSLRNALRWAGQEPPGTGGFGRFALKARANLVGPSVALTNVNVELDKNVAEGVMTYTIAGGHQGLQATLAAGSIDVTPYLSTIRLLASGARDWNRQLFDLTSTDPVDLDMRLSAAKVTIGSTTLGRTALSANLRGGALALSVGEAQVYGGIAQGTFGIGRSDKAASVKAQFQFNDVDLQTCAADLLGVRNLSGRGNLTVSLEAEGASPFGLAQSLDGSALLTGHDGAISGFNVEQLLKRLERRPLSGGGNFRSGKTPFDKLTVAVRFADGVATADEVRIEGPTARIALSGTASVPAREYDLKGVASLANGSAAKPGFDLPFIVQGPWDDPLIFPDPESLIRRSPASAPLLDAVKDRKTRDTVRSVLERITGKKQDAEPPAEAPAAAPAEPKAN
ncbi:AsmA protein [Rhodopseudomonas thermotolerans]|uniref:AsmA protein n=2 Tax=Rhodopseudomonas TaxID=1073 RepID=A0A336JPH7_9BRAD|nr:MULTISPECIES: AsmA family protein [Rhodopseudomonas]RED37934.1 AsmA protein [Rhodopseudomonas pentothenatexigens]REG05127.1 AsmA protein [Rhodopseudomonas thermotolerans]SSW89959.1 AsmA protein [Rhodopseudomonas pentothenatexigens]